MGKVVVWATDKEGEGDTLKVGTYDSPYEIRIPIGHFAPDVVLTFEEDMDEVSEAHRRRKETNEPGD